MDAGLLARRGMGGLRSDQWHHRQPKSDPCGSGVGPEARSTAVGHLCRQPFLLLGNGCHGSGDRGNSKLSPRVLRPEGKSRFVIFCDHASRDVPAELDNLGLPATELARHIAWDIGAAGIAETLANIFDATAVLSPVSRLVVDCNRHLTASDLIPEQSHGTVIPGNRSLSPEARSLRIERWFKPYHEAIESILTDRELRGFATIAISVHSMTDKLAGSPRPWPIAFSSPTDRTADRTLAQPMIDILRRSGVNVGDNEPYSMDPDTDYSIPFHAVRRNLPYLQVEFRQDEVCEPAGQVRWARLFARALSQLDLLPSQKA